VRNLLLRAILKRTAMHFNLKEIATATMVLFAVIDIVGSVPIIIDLRQKNGHLRSGLASIVALVIMILFLFSRREHSQPYWHHSWRFCNSRLTRYFLPRARNDSWNSALQRRRFTIYGFSRSFGVSAYCWSRNVNNTSFPTIRIPCRQYFGGHYYQHSTGLPRAQNN